MSDIRVLKIVYLSVKQSVEKSCRNHLTPPENWPNSCVQICFEAREKHDLWQNEVGKALLKINK